MGKEFMNKPLLFITGAFTGATAAFMETHFPNDALLTVGVTFGVGYIMWNIYLRGR